MSEERRCSVLFCSGHYSTGDEHLILFEFPKDAQTREKWIKAIHRMGFEPNEQSRVCAKHFDMTQVRLDDVGMQLVKGAVPRTHLNPLQLTENYNIYCGHFGNAEMVLEQVMSKFVESTCCSLSRLHGKCK